ncbi:MAG: anthrax toxin-like adenylyl cyclase domain-containing protein [Pseudomonadota bacterium]
MTKLQNILSPSISVAQQRVEGLIVGLNLVAEHKEQGIPKEDLQCLWDYVKKSNVVIMFRPVEAIAKTLLEEGECPTKDFNIKGKSASWGAWAGFIPVEQKYSKLAITNVEAIEKSNTKVQKCIEDGYAVSVPLIISESRYQELVKKQLILPQVVQDDDISLFCPLPNKQTEEIFYARKIDNKSEYAILTPGKGPFLVLADTKLQKPLIPDYDLLAVIPPWENYGGKDIRPNPDVTFTEYRKRRGYLLRQLSDIEKKEESFFSREIPNLGNVSKRVIEQIALINQVLGKGLYLDRVHHNEDINSPASDPKSNYPMTAFFPPSIQEFSGVFLIENQEAFKYVLSILSEVGYIFNINPLWDDSLKNVGKSGFFRTRDSYEFFNKMSDYLNSNDKANKLLKTIKDAQEGTPLFRELILLLNDSDVTYMSTVIHVLILLERVRMLDEEQGSVLKFAREWIENSSVMVEWAGGVDALVNKNFLTVTTYSTFSKLICELKHDLDGIKEVVAAIRSLGSRFAYVDITHIDKLFTITSNTMEGGELDRLAFKLQVNEFKKNPELRSSPPEIIRNKP